MSVGTLSCFLSYANQYTKPFNEISGVITELQNALACAGRVFELIDAREEIPDKVDSGEECIWLLTQQLARAMETGGIKACAEILMNMYGANAENAKALAYRLYTICERKHWAQEGYAYNNLVVAWPDILAMAAQLKEAQPEQLRMF